MVRIACCDDNADEREALVGAIRRSADELGVECSVMEFGHMEALVRSDLSAFDVAFLDVEMRLGQMDGMTAARFIRECNEEITLVFVTNWLQYAPEGYAVNAWRYILKPVSYPQLHLEMSRLLPQIERAKAGAAVRVRDGDEVALIAKARIVYVESRRKSVALHVDEGTPGTSTRTCVTRGPMSAWAEELSCEPFARCHVSYLVNLAYVTGVGRDVVRLRTGEELPLSKHRRRELLEAFSSYVGGRL